MQLNRAQPVLRPQQLAHEERLHDVAKGSEIVYVPCHRSHIDYLLVSYFVYHHGFVPPHVAAGLNLNLPVLGGILRKGGAHGKSRKAERQDRRIQLKREIRRNDESPFFMAA